MTVGRVVGIQYDEKTAGAIVDMEISQSFSQFSEDTSASILTAGLLGEKYIGLMTGGDRITSLMETLFMIRNQRLSLKN